MKNMTKAILAAVLALGAACAQAHSDVQFSFGVVVPPVYVAPLPPPVYVAPAPVYVAPPVYDGYYERRRQEEWRREQWRRRHWRHYHRHDYDD